MDIRVFENSDLIAECASDIIIRLVNEKPDCVIGFATGSSPVKTYERLIEKNKLGAVSFAGVTSFNLDEYCGIPEDDANSYHRFMRDKLFDSIDINPANINIPDGNSPDVEKSCREYDEKIRKCGGIDLQILGIGANGHIGFNEPSDEFGRGMRVVKLAESTIKANRRFFEREEDVPRYAVTMGVDSIFAARSIVLIATGEAKAQAVYDMIKGPVTPRCPASILQNHSDATVLLDRDAAKLL